jgi:putative RecB family exonuclease
MAYPLSATKLQHYGRCAHSFSLKYLKRVPSRPIRQPLLGKAVHQTLAQFYRWPGWKGVPGLGVMRSVWQETIEHFPTLSPGQIAEGWRMLEQYHSLFVQPLDHWHEPLAVEGKLEGRLLEGSVEFKIGGRCDRIERLPSQGDIAQLHLIDYKSSIQPKALSDLEVDLQLGLYQVAIAQRYGASLARVSHIYLRMGEVVSFQTRPQQLQLVQARIEELASKLVSDEAFEPEPGDHCKKCDYRQYCPAVSEKPQRVEQETGLNLQLSLC